MHRPVRFGFVLLLLLSLGRFAAAADETVPALLGFSAERSAAERALEKKLDAALDREDQKAWMKRLTAHPHHIGSEYDRQNSLFIADLFRSWGFTTRIEDFYPLFPTPKERVLELIAPTRFQPTLSEPPVPGDASSAQSAEMLPPFNAYSIDGDVTGELVYVNYGIPDDYEQLERRGIDVAGKIVIARYGHSWRGIKPKVAAEHGAIGCILYSDPADDGYGVGDVYPKGGWRNDRAVQRGSVADGPLHSGDPLTPGVGATKDAQRLDRKDAKTITKIPVLPISYGDALPFLKALDGPVVPPDWRGALPIAYHFGPGPAKVHLKLVFDWKLTPIHDVIAVLPGAELPDEWVIRGNHYDAWVHGALDPISGMVAVLSEAKAIGALAKDGWRPRRTLVYAAWDAEEPGLLGSVEWAETHADELRAKAVAYVNSDSNSRGYLGIRGSSSLEAMINDVARDVVDPEKSVSVWTRARATALIDGTAEEKREARDRPNLRIGPLGSGSDYTPFIQHLGIAALDLGYGGEEQYGQYHTAYDNFEHFSRFVDPDFAYGVILAQTGGRTVLRLAEADVLPFEFTGSADTISKYVDEVTKLADDLRDKAVEENLRIDDGSYALTFDPKETHVVPKRQEAVPYLNFAPLRNSLAALQASARVYSKAVTARAAAGKPLSTEERAELDRLLIGTERALTRPEGLPGRPWFVHQIDAPGFYTGYGAKTLPAVREAIEQKKWDAAARGVDTVAAAVSAYAAQIDRAAATLAK
ncbi:MAG TPA: transferrin receptor-like dimerization domain-containing protein [Thermoanaerobaculia bacterium]|nr:transferrin receptor-like dimerization domain-containing protein [Thermoanaerobaculia bacterium]